MAFPNPNPNRDRMYPKISDQTSPTSSLYPKIDMNDLLENLFPEPNAQFSPPSAPPEDSVEDMITLPGAILHLIDNRYSVELATGDLRVLRILQGDSAVVALASVGDEIQWPLTKDLAAVKLDSSHYFFSFRLPSEYEDSDSSDEDSPRKKTKSKKKRKERKERKKQEENEMLSYGLTVVSKGQEGLLKELDGILENYCNFSVHSVHEKEVVAVAGAAARETTADQLRENNQKEQEVKGQCAAYWTTLAPNVEDYSSTAARLIASGSGQLVKGILWCGDVTVDRLNWGNEVLKKRMAPGEAAEIDPKTLKRIKRVKKVTKMTEKVATGVLSGVVKVSGFFTGSVANSKMGKKFFDLLPGEMVLASLDGFGKVCDAVEIAGKSVMSTSSTVTTGLVSHRYGEEAAKAAGEGLDAAGHAAGTAWAVFKIRKALDPKSVMKPSTLAKAAAKSAFAEKKGKASK